MRKIELLSPAKDLQCGLEAISHGADAVYVGAPKFGARAAVGNSVADIESLVSFAHRYYARVYVALNTILGDDELLEAEVIIRQLYEAGVDALIIQDFGILSLNIPPIALHASTQMDNRTAEKVLFLQKAGFSQVVLARELSLEQIRDIHERTDVRLEAFVHGALCVSYSGQCYLSQAFCGRSANRGNCAQFCRLPYTLSDADGRILAKDKYLLSLQDLNMSAHLREMIEAGVSSLKIEGRLKDVSYVKNVTAFYRQRLDAVLDGSVFAHASSGKCVYTFVPNTEKSFHREGTSYFAFGRNGNIAAMNTPKSVGEYAGRVVRCGGGTVALKGDLKLANGDGMCYFDEKGVFSGFKVNRVEGEKLFPQGNVRLPVGTVLYRNYDQDFERVLSRKSAERKISLSLHLRVDENGFRLSATDEDGISVSASFPAEKQLANDAEKAENQLRQLLGKTGDTIYKVEEVDLEHGWPYFIPNSEVARWRRCLVELLDRERERRFVREEYEAPAVKETFVAKNVDYRGNVHNGRSVEFLKEHGVETVEPSFEKKRRNDAELMRCKYCIKHAMKLCPKQGTEKKLSEPLVLQSNSGWKVRLFFDCKRCEMVLKEYQ